MLWKSVSSARGQTGPFVTLLSVLFICSLYSSSQFLYVMFFLGHKSPLIPLCEVVKLLKEIMGIKHLLLLPSLLECRNKRTRAWSTHGIDLFREYSIYCQVFPLGLLSL